MLRQAYGEVFRKLQTIADQHPEQALLGSSENYKNYFQHAYGMNEKIEFIRKPSTRKRKLKIYK